MDDNREIQRVIDSFYKIISGKVGDVHDWASLRELFFQKGALVSQQLGKGETNTTTIRDVDSFISVFSLFLEKNDFYEYGLGYSINIYGSIAQVFSRYEAKRHKDDSNIIKSGTNLVQLLFDGTGWKIVSMLWVDDRS